nr:flap endonuclease-1 [Candidatus Sigynarchaeota archaeon]
MGVKINEIVADAKKTPPLASLGGKIIAIDAFNTLYSFLSSIRMEDGLSLTDSEGRSTSHLSGFFYRNAFLLENNIKPVYVFDGTPSTLKSETVAQRIEIREEAKKKAEEAREEGELDDAKKFAQASSKIEPHMISDIKNLLDLMGIPYVDAPGEGESQAAHMVAKGSVHMIASQDYDCFLFGATKLLRNLTQQKHRVIRGVRYTIEMESFELADVLKLLGIDRAQLVEIGILTGTDFNKGIRGVGQKTALKLVHEHGSIENIYKKKPEYAEQIPLALVDEVRDIFMHPRVTDDYKVHFSPIKTKSLVEFLVSRSFSENRVHGRILTIEKELKKRNQPRLDSFLS